MRTYEIFLFDADNTLYDYDAAEAYALQTTFEHCGFDYSESIRTKYRIFNTQVWDAYEKGEMTKEDLQPARFDRLFKAIGVQHDAKDFNAQYLVELGRGTFLIDGAIEVCKTIISQGKQTFIVTNGILATQESRIKHSLLKDYITDSFVSEVIGYKKPDIEYFEYVFSHIPQVSKDKILIIGDSLTADITGGSKAGIDSCWFNLYGISNNTKIKPTYEISRLSELIRFI